MAKKPKIGLALQGGGAHGAFTWGVLDRLLEEDRFEIVGVSGTSAGSVNAVAYAHYYMQGGAEGARAGLEEIWQGISELGLFFSPVKQLPFEAFTEYFQHHGFMPQGADSTLLYTMFDSFTRTFSPYQFNPFNVNVLRDFLNEKIDFKALKKCTKPELFISATNVERGRNKVFKHDEINVDVVMASAALPFLFQAVEIGGEHYWDGGYMGNPSLYPLYYETEACDIVVVHINPIERRGEVPTNAGDIMNRINEITFNSSLLAEFRAIAFVDKLIDQDLLKEEAKKQFRRIYMHSIRADEYMKQQSVASKFRSDWAFIMDLKEEGRTAADKWLHGCAKHVGKRDSIDLKKEFLNK